MVNIHQMKTRSKKDKRKSQDSYNRGGDNSDDEYDEIDEYGNLIGFIDYDCNEDFDRKELDNQLKRLSN